VTWCGCGRVEFFEGCEKRREDCESTKRGEPHDWQRDATSPQPFERRKPSRWCKTTRTERDSEAGSLGTEPDRQQCRFGGVDAREGCRWRGVTTPEFARQRGPQGQQSQLTARVVSAKLGLSRRIPREEVGENPTRATGEHSVGEPRPEGPLVILVLRDEDRGATPSENLEDPPGNR
jgi:hypothetical protein